jgi:hypothetical protein
VMKVVRNGAGYAVAFGPNDDNYEPGIPAGCTLYVEEDPDLTPPPPTQYELEEIKRRLLAAAIPKRDFLLMHLRWFYTKATEERAAAKIALDAAVGQPAIDAAQAVFNAAHGKVQAIDAAITSLMAIFTDQRVIDAVDGEAKEAVQQVYLEIFQALGMASPATYYAMLALDPL